MNPAISVQLDQFTYAGCDSPVLQDVHFTVFYGQVTLLSGLSGSGKSTLLSLINGVIPRIMGGEIMGNIQIDGEDIVGWTMSRISQKVGSVLQNAELQIIHQQVEDEIAFGCENLGIPPDEIERRIASGCQAMELLPEWKTRTLSGGQKQRLITASTLAMQPDILIFDEPLANLDQHGAISLLLFLKELASAGKAILLVEHRLDVVMPYVDSVWELHNKTTTLVLDQQQYFRRQIGMIQDTCVASAPLKPLMVTSSIQRVFGTRTVLEDISFTLYEGQRLLLLGENGCGKSTLLQLLARLQKPTAGSIQQYLNPSFGKKANKQWFSSVGYVYQNPNYQLFMPSVKEELLFGTTDATYALELAERFQLTNLLDQHPQSLSEGQKRRVTIAAILAQKPKLLLLDEPTVGQDYAGLREMIQVINQIHLEQGNTMITVTHDFRCATALCDVALWLENGRVKSHGGKELAEAFFRRNGFE